MVKRGMAIGLLILVGQAIAGPGLELGFKGSRYNMKVISDGEYRAESGFGIGAEFLLNLKKNFGLRADLLEFRSYDGGGSGLEVNSGMSLDGLYEIPAGWRLTPYGYGGFGLKVYKGDFCFNLRAGLGLQYPLSRRLKAFLAVDLVKVLGDDDANGVGLTTGGPGQKISLGVRFKRY
jgi:hypothetical protein